MGSGSADAEIRLEYLLILREMRMLEMMPSAGNRYEERWDLVEPAADAMAAPARLPMDVFCRIIGRQPMAVGRRKSTRKLTSVAARL